VPELLRLAVPAVLAGLVSTAVFFTDRLLLGHFDDRALGSMQVAGPWLWSLFNVFGALRTGATTVVGRAVGAGDTEAARRATVGLITVSAGIGLLLAVFGLASRDLVCALMTGTGPEAAPTRELARIYLTVVFPTAPLVLAGEAGIAALQASGDTRTPMRIGIAAGATNLGLSWLLLFGLPLVGLPGLGMAGAALGTAASFVVMGILVAVALLAPGGLIGPVGRQLARRWSGARSHVADQLRRIGRVSLPGLGEKLLFHTGFMVFAGLVGHLGETAMAANQSLLAIESLGFIGAGGFGVAAGALVAQKLGAGAPREARQAGWLSAGLGMAALGAVGLVFLIVPEQLVGLFSSDPDVVALGARCLRIAALAQPLMAVTDALAGALRGAGDTVSPMVVALLGPVVVRLAACYLLAVVLDMGLVGIWLGTTLDWLVRAAVLAGVWAWSAWEARGARRAG
jgi:putative MATE family efflux protein